MDLKGIEGRATLGDDTITLIFDSKLALDEKKAASPHAIPLKHVLEIDFAAPTTWKPGHLRIIMRDGQERAKLHSDLYAIQLGAGRRLKEAQEFVAKLRAAVDAVEYEAPELPELPAVVSRQTKTWTEIKAESNERNAQIKAEFEESDPGIRLKAFKEANAELIAGFKEANAAYDDARKSNVSFRGIRLAGRTIRKGGKSWAANECEIIIDTGANVSSRVTGTASLPGR